MRDATGTVLIGYDGSEDAAAAIRRAGELLGPRRALVAYVWDSLAALLLHTDVEGLSGTMREAADELDEVDAREAEVVVERGVELARTAGFDSSGVGARGTVKAWPTLLELAKEHAAVAVVVGSRGHGQVTSALFGSVSSGVIDHAHLPVLVVPPLEETHAPGPVLIAYDGSERAGVAVEAAGRLLAVRETVLQTIWTSYHAVASAGAAGVPAAVVTTAAEEIDREARRAAERTAEQGARLAEAAGLEVQAEAVEARGNVWSTLLDSAHAHHAAALVVGSRGRGTVGAALLGSVSRALVHHAPAPVLIVRPPER